MITPFYTHLNKKDEACAILVNRGWVPWDLKDVRLDRQVNETVVKGVLYRGDPKTKYSQPNQPSKPFFRNVNPEELAVVINLPNDAEASQFIVRAVDFDL